MSKDLRPTDAHLQRMLVEAHEKGMAIGRRRNWKLEGPTYPNFSIHAARYLIEEHKKKLHLRTLEAEDKNDTTIVV